MHVVPHIQMVLLAVSEWRHIESHSPASHGGGFLAYGCFSDGHGNSWLVLLA